MGSRFDAERSAVLAGGREERVGVNQRALIDKILARYATAYSAYRELLQNSNDAGATRAEVRFSTALSDASSAAAVDARVVREAVYRNNGAVFNKDDWSRLTTIASGNPNPDHIGFFGVGAFTLFSVAEEPMVTSGRTALVFKWKGDALFTKLGTRDAPDDWTSFVLPARDPYPVPNLDDFGEFLANSLTFTKCLAFVEVFVDDTSVLAISKSTPHAPTVITPPATKSWWNPNAAVLSSPRGIFSLAAQDGALTDTRLKVSARYGGKAAPVAHVSARVVSVTVVSKVPPELRKRMVRVTKKEPVRSFSLQILLPDAGDDPDLSTGRDANKRRAQAVLARFSPRLGAGRVYIGFRTSQTTGVACHLAAPLIPTVEREAIDLVDPTLAVWNSELLHIAGVVMRLALEHGMSEVGEIWKSEATLRGTVEEDRVKRIRESVRKLSGESQSPPLSGDGKVEESRLESGSSKRKSHGLLSGFASFMGQAASEVKRIASVAVSAVIDDSNLLSASDSQPLAPSERKAIVLMRSFEPAQSSPDTRVGSLVARGFEGCLPNLGVPVITQAGILRGDQAFTPFHGIERFFATSGSPLVRSVVVENAGQYVQHMCRVKPLSLSALAVHLGERDLSEDELLLLLIWFCQFARKDPEAVGGVPTLKNSIRVTFAKSKSPVPLLRFSFYASERSVYRSLPLPPATLPSSFSSRLPARITHDGMLSSWFAPLPWREWALFITRHPAFVSPRSPSADDMRDAIWNALASEHARVGRTTRERGDLAVFLQQQLGNMRCVPTESGGLELPGDVYLPEAELEVFSGVGLKKVSSALIERQFISSSFLSSLGVREAVSIDVLLSELDSLSWNRNPSGLVQYLCSVSSKISSDEWKRLRRTKFLPSVADEVLHTPSELCLPSRELQSLPLPFLKWNGTVAASSAEAEVLCSKLGVKRSPPLSVLLEFASKEGVEQSARAQCIWYAAKGIDEPGGEYKRELTKNPSVLSKKFLPCQRIVVRGSTVRTDTRLLMPSECFISQPCAMLGFWAVFQQFERASLRFGVKQEPSGRQYVQALLDAVRIAKSGRDLDNKERYEMVWRCIQLLSPHVGSISADDRNVLLEAHFVPVQADDAAGGLAWRRPCDVYFGNRSRLGGNESTTFATSLFDIVPENDLLRAVGVKDEPNLKDLCEILLANPDDVFKKLETPEKYEELLQRIASQLSSLPQDYILRLKKCPFLLATQLGEVEGTETRDSPNQSEGPAVQRARYVLARASEIVIVDDAYLQRMFKPLCAPLDSALEVFYSQLGSEYISRKVTRRFRLLPERQEARSTPMSHELSERILQRKALILETSSRRLIPGAAGIFTTSTLQVRQVQKIVSVYTLSGHARTESVSCCPASLVQGHLPISVPRLSTEAKLILFCTSEIDFFDVASSVGRQVFARCGLQDVFLLAQLLETTLAQLRSRGFPVDRIVQARDISSLSTREEEAEEAVSGGATPMPATRRVASENDASRDGPEQIITNMFPDVDQKWLSKVVRENPGPDGLRAIKRGMESGEYPKVRTDRAAGGAGREQSTRSDSNNTDRAEDPKPLHGGSATKGNIGRTLMRALRNRGQSGGLRDATADNSASTSAGVDVMPQSTRRSGQEKLSDEDLRRGSERALRAAVSAASVVPPGGVVSPTRSVVPNIESEANHESCEIITGQNLIPFRVGSGAFKTSEGFRVFISRLDEDVSSSIHFCETNRRDLERFSNLLFQLTGVFGVVPRSVAIFYARDGNTIAFNANGSLHFNLRFFTTLHSSSTNGPLPVAAYIYWYTTFAHELSHNLVADHNQRHGHFTECFIAEYFLKLLNIIPEERM